MSVWFCFFFSKALSTSYWANCCLQHEKIQLVNVSTAQIRVLRDERKYCECRTASTLPTVSFSLVSLVYKCGWLASHLITMWEVSQFKVRLASLFSLWRFFLPYQSFSCFYFLFLETKCYSSLFQTNFFISHSAVHFLPRGLEDGWNNLKIKSNIKLNFCCWFLNWIKKNIHGSHNSTWKAFVVSVEMHMNKRIAHNSCSKHLTSLMKCL